MMVSVYQLKSGFQKLLRPITNFIAKIGVTANQITMLAMIFSCAVGGYIALYPQEQKFLLVIPAFLFVRMALNAIDGMLAREHNMKSNLGTFLNELGDVVSDAGLYLPLALVAGFNPFLVVAIVILAIISEMTGVIAVQIGTERKYDGPMGKSDRAFIFGLLCLLIGLDIGIVKEWLTVILYCVSALLFLTIFNRISSALKATNNKSNKE